MAGASKYEVVIGLEVHAQLLTDTKLFCADTTEFGLPPNTSVSAISLGHPGTLPKLNKEAIDLAIRLGLATNCTIVRQNYFARKNYFYPDLPKGYQVSQHTTPICKEGFLEITVGDEQKKIRINRIHMEEDAGKSIHDADSDFTNVDFNRAGIPLVEIVTEPDLSSGDEAAAYLTQLRSLVRHLKVCDGNMEQGSFRCDVNISLRKQGDQKLGTKVEIKNLNSIRFMKKAVEYEIEEMAGKLDAGEKILQQTKGFDEKSGTTYTIRIKEDEDDYRYFPEPDLPPFSIDDAWLNRIQSEMPPLQEEIRKRLSREYNLSAYDTNMLTADAAITAYFLAVASETKNYKSAANWISGPVKNYCDANDIDVEVFPVLGSSIATLINLVDEGKINYGTASQKLLPALIEDPGTDINKYIEDNNLQLQSGDETDKLIEAALTKHAEKITEYKKGKKGLLSLFVGEVMKLSKGKADAKMVTDKIVEKLKG